MLKYGRTNVQRHPNPLTSQILWHLEYLINFGVFNGDNYWFMWDNQIYTWEPWILIINRDMEWVSKMEWRSQTNSGVNLLNSNTFIKLRMYQIVERIHETNSLHILYPVTQDSV